VAYHRRVRGSVGICVGVVLAAVVACSPGTEFTCQDDEQCGQNGSAAILYVDGVRVYRRTLTSEEVAALAAP
jgi:hypothetical protein